MKRFARKQRGHVTVLTLLFFSVVGLASIGMYNAGQQTTNKVRIQTISDAAAHSVALVVSRDLNFKAHTNRAMVANQVALAQIVGLASWARMLKHAGENFNTATTPLQAIPYVGVVIRIIGQVIERATYVFDQAISRVAPILAQAQELVLDVISAQQTVHHGLTVALARSTLDDVVTRSDSTINTGSLVTNGFLWTSFFDAWEGEQERISPPRRSDGSRDARLSRERLDEFRVVTENSRDGFTRQRTHNWFSIQVWGIGGARIRKYGGSELMPSTTQDQNYNYNWTAMDVVGAEMRSFDWWDGWGSWRDTGVPFGWGAAHVLTGNARNFMYSSYRNTQRNGRRLWGDGTWRSNTNAWLANSQYGSNNLTSSRGLRAFYDLEDRGRINEDALNIKVLLTKGRDDIATWEKLLRDNGRQVQATFNTEEGGGLPNDRMAALSKAGIYFSRDHAPRTGSGTNRNAQREYGNLYNPYWQVRLLPPNATERGVALAAVGFVP